MLDKITLQQNDFIDKVIEKIVYMIFEEDVEINEPQETIEQIKAIFERDGI